MNCRKCPHICRFSAQQEQYDYFKFVTKTFNMKNNICFISFLLFASVFLSQQAISQTTNNAYPAKVTGYAPINGLKMYYEVYGEGQPLVLIHGSYMSIDLNYAQIIPELAKNYKVIALEMQGHGRTADIDRDYSFDALAEDVAGLLKYLNINNATVLGYSLGATIALNFTITHPEMVNKLVFISSVYKSDGWIPAVRNLFPLIKPEFFEHTPLKTEYNRLAPDTSHWHAWVTKLAKFDASPFDLGIDNIKKIKCPVLIIKADNDGVDLTEVNEMYTALGGGVSGDMGRMPKSQLAIIPNTTHVTLMMQTTQLLNYIDPFLKK